MRVLSKLFTLLGGFVLLCSSLAMAAPSVDAEVRKVDKDAKKITLKHNEIKNLDIPAMSMAFQVKDPSFLEKVKVGDAVRFTAEKINGAYTITSLEVK
jgi:Cu/Ag efflux protein CusF